MDFQQSSSTARRGACRTSTFAPSRDSCEFASEVMGVPVKDRACLYVANHVSWLDIVVLSTIAPMCFIAKREVAGWPLFGTLASVGRTLYIDRDRRHDVGRSPHAMQQRLHDGEIVTLFAEGKSSDGNRVLPFRSALVGAADR